MSRPATETPAKSCEQCGATFIRARYGGRLECLENFRTRRFCSLSCSVSNQRAAPPPTIGSSRKRAAHLKLDHCEACGAMRVTTQHHVNGNPMDNRPENLQTLCVNCHSFWHAALKRSERPCGERMPNLFPS